MWLGMNFKMITSATTWKKDLENLKEEKTS